MDTYRHRSDQRPVISHLKKDGIFMKDRKNNMKNRIVTLLLTAAMIVTALPVISAPALAAVDTSVTATGKVSESGVILRKSASTSSDVVATLKANKKLTIHKEFFTKKKSTKAKNRWYYVTAGKKSGYIRSDLVKDISWANAAAVATDALNFRTGPATTFKTLGTTNIGEALVLRLPAAKSGSKLAWYRVTVRGKTAYVSADYIKFGTSLFIQKSAQELAGKSDLAKALLSNPTRGGKARIVYTFTPDNCTKRFAVKGYKKAKVPQGFTYTGSEYYLVYGMAVGQSVVTYGRDGTRLGASKFAFSIGHPNGITYDPVTKLCYVFKGNQKRIYTWNPATNKFGKSKTPYSSSGVAYDNATGLIYATSHSGIRAYTADGKFRHQKIFSRCKPGFYHYIQDCGAGEGFIFHGVSGRKKKTKNQLDIYRAEDMAYLGTIKITIGEYESAVVGPDGYLELLINTSGNTDYIWRTPLNVNELK